MKPTQRSLDGYLLVTKEDLKEVVREVLKEKGIPGFGKKHASWDCKYWGKENWLECRARVLRLIHQNLILAWGDLDQDPYFHQPKKEGGAVFRPDPHRPWEREDHISPRASFRLWFTRHFQKHAKAAAASNTSTPTSSGQAPRRRGPGQGYRIAASSSRGIGSPRGPSVPTSTTSWRTTEIVFGGS